MQRISPASVAELREVVAECNVRPRTLRIAGNETWMHAGRPVTATHLLSTKQLQGIVEYVPGDLVLTAMAGTTLEQIADATRKHSQWLALDPYGHASGTLGASIATASAGALVNGFGQPRDLVLGLQAVTGTGEAIAVGGRVVKNVAGFDLVRLLTGSWGTLGVLTQISVRLHALPQCDQTFAVFLNDESLSGKLALLRALRIAPMAMQLVNVSFARSLLTIRSTGNVSSSHNSHVLLVRLGGNIKRVGAQQQELHKLGVVEEIDTDVWRKLRLAEQNVVAGSPTDGNSSAHFGAITVSMNGTSSPCVFRVSDAPSRLSKHFRAVEDCVQATRQDVFISASPLHGTIRVVVHDGELAAAIFKVLLAHGATIVGERLPAVLWQQLASPIGDALSSGIRARFDPHRLLNTGILGENRQ